MNESQIKEKIEHYLHRPIRQKLNIFQDTTEYMKIGSGDVLELGGKFYFVRGEEVEGRFGMDGDPKYWVKKVIDLDDGSSKIVKLVFFESFFLQLGTESIKCFRSPQKEARILEKIRNDPYFMQGFNVQDKAGNSVRIIDRIQGKRFFDYILDLAMDHEAYFYNKFPEIFDNILLCIEAIRRLHSYKELHGDIRNDHIFIDKETGIYKWIDFDYTYDWAENPFGVDLFGLGNVLLLTIGGGFHTVQDLSACGPEGMQLKTCLTEDDMSLFFKHRVMNLKKLFPYIPDEMNHILLHFSHGAEVFYESTEELLHDLKACRKI
ncbi:hypothetical protein [Desulforhabdus amnigena]|jgi:hypothetical protein|uniref:Protein kinase domain-containing protein n=1 Tax=Desulforhabdus amnigena TaxID=40218 RepID=A0A9W6FWG1_9BACT|nr:hypothetical protein [Desulforhabdus amnigena]NLJ29464.1 serine/threonine protein kinase [Deltaproteobacteria bacterium]GLI36146.1 hypothetical protein DAMNIGENAA_35790 [Desulforhabdus amnigena]